MKRIFTFLFLTLSILTLNSQTTYYWRNDQNPGNNASWQSTSPYYFWNGSSGAIPSGAEKLYFDGNQGITMTNNLSATNRWAIEFGSTNATSRTINGSTTNIFYDYSNGIPFIYNGSGVAHTINFPFQIGNTSTLSTPAYGLEINASTGNLTFGSSATISAQNSTGTKVLVLRASGGGSGTIALNGVISNGSGTMSIQKNETNTATLGALNTYTGSTAITGGTLRAGIAQNGSSGAFGNNSTVTVSSGATLDLNGKNNTVASVSETGSGNGGNITLGNGILTMSGGWAGTLYQNSITGTGGLTKQGTGTLSLYGTQSYSGTTTVSGGEISSAVNMSSSAYTINGGTLRTASANILSTSCDVTLSSGTFAVDNSQTINNLNLSGGTLTIANGQTLTINGTLTYSGSPTITLTGTGKIAYGTNGALTINSSITTNDIIWPVSTTERPKSITIGANVTLHATKIIPTALTITSGNTFDVGINALRGNSFTTSGTGTLTTQSTVGQPLPPGKTWSFTVNYNANGSQTVVAGTYNNLTCTNSSIDTKIIGGDVTVNGVLTLSTSMLSINGYILSIGGTVSMSATNSLTGSNTSTLNVSSSSTVGTVYFYQNTSADVSTTDGTNALNNLVVSGSGGSVTLGNKVNLFNKLSVSAGTLNTGGFLVLRSTTSNTAYVDQVGGTISGQAIVERYFHKQFRGWRMVTSPVTFNGIVSNDNDKVFNNWQSDFGYAGNYGTNITANVTPSGTNGIDYQTQSSNLLTYNSTGSGSWNKVVNTKTETMSGNSGSADNKGFFLFLRGDRTVIPSGAQTPNAYVTTTLASKGLLQTGTQSFTYGGASGNSWLIGNPYACPVDMSAVTYNNIGNFVYFWDPNLTGIATTSPGAYTYFDRTNWAAGPVSGSSTKYFQSGQAFLVKPTSISASISFSESNKTGGNNNTQTTKGSGNGLTDLFNVRLFAVQSNGDRTNVDGVRAKFGSYLSIVDDEDCKKIATSLEGLAIANGTDDLAIEARPFIAGVEELPLKLSNMAIGSNYEFTFNPIDFDVTVTDCKLVDAFLNIETPISLTNNTIIPFTITNVTGSNNVNRFKVVFNSGTLAINDINLKAAKQNDNISVSWQVEKESDMSKFILEKSSTGTDNFKNVFEVKARNGNINNNYSFTDNKPAKVNYYRIKAIDINGREKYSSIARVDINSNVISSVRIYPNPVSNNNISLQLNNIAEGKATVKIFNALGQVLQSSIIDNAASTGSLNIQLNNLAAGTYQMQLTDANGNIYKEQIVKVK